MSDSRKIESRFFENRQDLAGNSISETWRAMTKMFPGMVPDLQPAMAPAKTDQPGSLPKPRRP